MGKPNLTLPSLNFVAKTAIALVAIVFVVNMIPASWGLKKWFTF